ncbi:kunitz-type protease inhibitor 2-like [Carcharodon carcharias]|uniref:kunitz-type protease inhibitor 2-like n=1 Tax=Carcharodon carcharias TaxID=13397 RepID=UPI001B7DBBAE|nr:kunitz-type protease inhibitor 2-like [Carcharodon carcharias]
MAQRSSHRRFWPLLTWMLLGAAVSQPLESCLGSYSVSQGISLHRKSFEDGAEILATTLVNGSQDCRAVCCSTPGCNLALLEQEGAPGGSSSTCSLVNCLSSRGPVCTFERRPGYETSSRSDPDHGGDPPIVVPTVQDGYASLTEHPESGSQDNEQCNAPKKVGDCKAAIPRWYFDTQTQTCQLFIYGGCRGNKNNYKSKEKCLATCAGQKKFVPEPLKLQLQADDEDYCYALAVTGHCRASFPRWYYNPQSQTCGRFTYGGCGGNKNNYESEAECLARCLGKTDDWKMVDGGHFDEQLHPVSGHHVSAILLVVLLSICILILLGGVIYFIVRLSKTEQTISYQRAPRGEDKETLINTVQNL